jgi:hypothetical protein
MFKLKNPPAGKSGGFRLILLDWFISDEVFVIVWGW